MPMTHVLACWQSRRSEGRTGISFVWDAVENPVSGVCWVPEGYDHLVIRSQGPLHAPWKAWEHALCDSTPETIEVVLPEQDGGELDVRVTAPHGEGLCGTTLMVAGTPRGGSEFGTRIIRTGDDGHARAVLPEGGYRVRLYPGFGPTLWRPVEVRSGRSSSLEIGVR